MTAFQRALDVMFTNPNFSFAAVYRSRFGVKTVRVKRKRPDQVIETGQARFTSESHLFEVRVSDIPVPGPEAGDKFELQGAEDVAKFGLGSRLFEVHGESIREDANALVWVIDARPLRAEA
ncbi:MAG: hypothetical protein MI920_02020 [Kiloniellales bacterium]|nr:hypothetical protein [Kiloniellales bacterium]